MAVETRISWCKSTFNPWIGCTRVSPGCDNCYAAVSTPARTMRIKWGPGEPKYRTGEANWKQPLRWNAKASRTGEFWPVFCASLGDVFDNEVPPFWRADLFDLIAATPALTWLLLSKRIGNARPMMSDALCFNRAANRDGMIWALPNVWIGASVVNQEEADRDIPKLLAVPAAKRFVSYEPALGPIEFSNVTKRSDAVFQCGKKALDGIDWVIVGGESDQPGAKARPFDVRWARSTVQQCKAAGVACFVKQLGSAPNNWCAATLEADADYLAECDFDHCDNYEAGEQGVVCFQAAARCVYLADRAGADPSEWPEDLRVQQFPDGRVMTPNADITGAARRPG